MSIAKTAAHHLIEGYDIHSTIARFVQSVNRLSFEEKTQLFQEFKDALKKANWCTDNNLDPQVRVDMFRAVKMLNLTPDTHQALLNVLGKKI